MHKGSLISPTLVICHLFDDNHFDRCDISLWFWFAFPWWLVMLSIFSCVYWLSVCLLWKMSIWVLCPFFKFVSFLMLSCMSSLYILDINPLSNILFGGIVYHSIGHLFIFLIVSFTVQSFLVWCSPLCLFLHLFSFPEETDVKKILLRLMSKSILPVFSARSFMVSCLTFKSLIRFEFFLYGMRK